MVSERIGEGPEPARFCDGWHARLDARIRALVDEHATLRALCDRLETIADGLPGLPPPEERQSAARELTNLLPGHQRREEVLLEGLLPLEEDCTTERALLGRIRDQHVADRVHAQDLGAALEAADGGGDGQALGYMLRCFFDGCRRAMAFEELAILSLARQRLSPETGALLAASLRAGPGRPRTVLG